MIYGNVKYVGQSLFHDVVFPDRIVKVEKGKYVTVNLGQCKELIETGNFIPDEETREWFRKFENSNKKKNIDGLLKGKNCFVIGGGNSLRGFDFSLLDNKFTISINHTVIYYPNSKACIFLDARFLETKNKEARAFLKTYKGMIFSSYKTLYHRDNSNTIPFYVCNDRVTKHFSHGLYGTRLSGLVAINLAIVMQADKIYLLGFDLDKDDKYVHFYDNEVAVYGNDKGYRGFRVEGHIKSFRPFKEYSDKIINLNPKSKIPYFTFQNPEEVINGV